MARGPVLPAQAAGDTGVWVARGGGRPSPGTWAPPHLTGRSCLPRAVWGDGLMGQMLTKGE